ncbi:hypothetical protein [Streptomyces morookaense]|uniref:Uncharacterized protein n=1 Tax=Streptomyces morookaense TaxID=1970 RepID=A0A7Y7B9Y4_STRMO|nr:hypothetical protein [Streptomyces morookaense]NVK81679.1 hypothetical protein [Streptomyces morookaense]GHF42249.1 hypothetical protein GCM10010359_50940 [Streptomyces morookaense]
MSYNQPGPYGQPPQPPQGPNPYGQGGAPGQPGYGYPQQAPPPQSPYAAPPVQPPYGAPQQPQQGGWGQPPQPPQAPQQGGWGQPGMPGGYPPPPAKSGGAGKGIAIAVGALVVVGAVVGGIVFLSGGSSGGGKVKPYTIVLPDSLLDGQYTKGPTQPGAQTSQDLTNNDKTKALGIDNGTGVSGRYTNGQKQVLSVAGVYGEVPDPAKTVDAMLAQMDENEKKLGAQIHATYETTSPATEYHPSGFDGAVMKCLSKKVTINMGTISSNAQSSTCIWADSSAVGVVTHEVPKTSGGLGGGMGASGMDATGDVMSPKDLSDATAKVRTAVRKDK